MPSRNEPVNGEDELVKLAKQYVSAKLARDKAKQTRNHYAGMCEREYADEEFKSVPCWKHDLVSVSRMCKHCKSSRRWAKRFRSAVSKLNHAWRRLRQGVEESKGGRS